LRVHDEAVARNLATYGTFAATERLLLELVRAGAGRQAMHEVIRVHAMAAWNDVQRGDLNPLAGRLAADPEVLRYLPAGRVRELLDATGHVGDAPERACQMAAAIREHVEGGAR
jgi:adenylosuccinate lyase